MAITVNIAGGLVQLSGNPVDIDCSGGIAPANSTGYRILLRVISEDGKLEGAPFTDAKAPDAAGNAAFDISGYVDQPVQAKFQYPINGSVVAYPTQAFNVQIQAGEFWIDGDGNDQETWGAVSSIVQMLKGGLNPRQISLMNDENNSFYKMYVQGNKFLTPRPQSQEVHPTQFVKLWYMVDGAKNGVTFKLKTVFDDASIEYYTSAAFDLSADNLYEFNCNPAHFGIDIEQENKKAVFFEAYIDFNGSTSQVRQFYYDWNYCERPIFLFFANSLGGIDDVYFSGYITDLFSTEGETAVFPFLRSNTVYDPTLQALSKTGQNHWELNSGWKQLTDMQYLRDLMLARQAWYLYSNKSQTTFNIIPVLIEDGEKTIVDRKEDLYSISLKVSEAHKSSFVFDNRSY